MAVALCRDSDPVVVRQTLALEPRRAATVKPSPFHQWLHKLPPSHVQALRDFRRCARAAYPDERDYLAKALDAGEHERLLHPSADPRKPFTPAEAARAIAEMPRGFVLAIDPPKETKA